MKLNLNFDGFTKLRDWWNTVRSNFEIIEDECNKTRKIADNACTKEEARAYINEFIGLSDDYMAAIEAFTELYKENESTVAAMDEVYGSRLKYYSKEEAFDVNEAVGEDAIFFCKAETENTPSNQSGILISKTDNKQMWIAENGEIFYRQFADDVWGEWESSFDKLNDDIEKINKSITKRARILTGTYEGNGSHGSTNKTSIPLDEEPKIVFVAGVNPKNHHYSGIIFNGVTGVSFVSNEVKRGIVSSYDKTTGLFSWYSLEDATTQLNNDDTTYTYYVLI